MDILDLARCVKPTISTGMTISKVSPRTELISISEARARAARLEQRQPTIADETRKVVGETPLDSRSSSEGRAIVVSQGFQCKRPNRLPQKSRGHGIKLISDPGAKLKNKKIDLSLKPKRPEVPVPDFLTSIMRERVRCQPLVQSAGAVIPFNATP